MSDHGEPNGDGETDEERDRRWKEHAERFDAVVALERRLGSLEAAVREGSRDNQTKFELVLAGIKEQREGTKDLHKLWVRLIDGQIETEKRVAALEAKPRRGKKKR